MSQPLVGTVHGNTIVFRDPLPIPEGQAVEVIVRPSRLAKVPGEGILRSAGALAGEFNEEDEQILEEIYQARHAPNRRDTTPSAAG